MAGSSYTSAGVPHPFSPVQFSIEVVYSQSAIKPELFPRRFPLPSPTCGSSGRGPGKIIEEAGGYPGDQWPGPLAGSSPVVQASVSWWCHLLAPGQRLSPSAGQGGTAWVLRVPCIRNKQTNQGYQQINPHLGDREEPLFRHTESWETMAMPSSFKKSLKFFKAYMRHRPRDSRISSLHTISPWGPNREFHDKGK